MDRSAFSLGKLLEKVILNRLQKYAEHPQHNLSVFEKRDQPQ